MKPELSIDHLNGWLPESPGRYASKVEYYGIAEKIAKDSEVGVDLRMAIICERDNLFDRENAKIRQAGVRASIRAAEDDNPAEKLRAAAALTEARVEAAISKGTHVSEDDKKEISRAFRLAVPGPGTNVDILADNIDYVIEIFELRARHQEASSDMMRIQLGVWRGHGSSRR